MLAPIPSALPRGVLRRLLRLLFGPSRRERLEQRKRRAEAAWRSSEADNWAQGRSGENMLEEVLARRLDRRYVLFRNYTPAAPWDAGGDVDAVLLGPEGVTVFEVKAWRGAFLNEGASWWRWCGPRLGWQPAFCNPSEQAIANANRIRETLRRTGLDAVPVRPIVAVADPEMEVEMRPPLATFVFFACHLRPRLDAIAGGRYPSPPLPDAALAKVYTTLLASVGVGAVVR